MLLDVRRGADECSDCFKMPVQALPRATRLLVFAAAGDVAARRWGAEWWLLYVEDVRNADCT